MLLAIHESGIFHVVLHKRFPVLHPAVTEDGAFFQGTRCLGLHLAEYSSGRPTSCWGCTTHWCRTSIHSSKKPLNQLQKLNISIARCFNHQFCFIPLRDISLL